jgi:hypothetical protein
MTLDELGNAGSWPEIAVAPWAGTKRSLHMYAQMLGKMRLVLSPPQPNWMFTALYLNARGITTGVMPCDLEAIEATIDLFDSRISLARSDGRRRDVALFPVRTVAAIYADLTAALEGLDADCFISPIPQEVADATPFDRDRRPAEYDPDAALRWFRAVTATAGVFDRWRRHFFGRSGIQLWWGAFDFAMILFSGKHVPAPSGRGYLMRFDLDAALMNVGLFLGDEQNPPFFYGYIYPEPAGAAALPVSPAQASWSERLREWTLPYDAVRSSADPAGAIDAFVGSIYEQCVAVGGWNRKALSYDPPPHVRRP